jgi:predicted nucleotidyltransferase
VSNIIIWEISRPVKIEKDYEEFFVLLNKRKVRYCIVGSYAVAFYAKPRYTKDIDIFIEPSKSNTKKIVRVLEEFGFRSQGISESDFLSEGRIIQLGYEPVRIDLITAIQGCDFGQVWKNKCVGKYGKEKVYFIGLNDLIRNKKLAARHIDRSDLEILQKAKTK